MEGKHAQFLWFDYIIVSVRHHQNAPFFGYPTPLHPPTACALILLQIQIQIVLACLSDPLPTAPKDEWRVNYNLSLACGKPVLDQCILPGVGLVHMARN